MNNDLVTDAVCTKKNHLLTIFDFVVSKDISNIHWELQKIPSCFTLPERIGKTNCGHCNLHIEM